ncbi:HAMP domain-containing sensor histidine kinase [Longimicrobium sp.]|uniref:sensor histidine kinase n=1 Tax=Longimicrobium sp. TaxID=2029185 RepID=UPI002B5B336C|nr:HAMP domain-containing sensor histidine kinase [Longimicrobium sp.]HSU15502.1 HAMP domain-containing sensor histidine kinase [Longimicrobium sp.]
MTLPRRSPHLAPGSAVPVALLLMLLGLSAVLAYQAADAARSEARSTERALRGYASFATWELERRADDVLRARLSASLADALAGAPTASALASDASRALAWCRCTDAVQGALRVSPDGGEMGVAAPDPAIAAWLRARGAAMAVSSSSDSIRIEAVTIGRARHLFIYRDRGDAGRRGMSGLVLDPRRLASAAFDAAYRAGGLLPGAVRAGGQRDAVAAALSTADGAFVWQSPPPSGAARDGVWVDAKIGAYPPEPLARGDVAQPLDGLFAGLVSRVSVRADAVVGAPAQGPHSRLPLLLAVFGLTMALVCVAIVQLRRQQELVQLRDDFVSGVSHELRTPLAQIRLFSDLLDSGRMTGAEQRARSVRIIAEESRRLSWLVENILHFSRAQRGAGRVQPNPVETAPLIREIVDSFAPLARTREAEFAVEADEGVVARIDPDALRQVLLNLLDNAVKYGPPGQTVRVRAELRGLALRIAVDDRGPGVPWEERTRVWEPYRRLARDAEGATGGSGIGLAVVKDLVELHGGRAGVGEAPGGGARFWVEFPYAMHAGPAPEPAAAHVAGAAR